MYMISRRVLTDGGCPVGLHRVHLSPSRLQLPRRTMMRACRWRVEAKQDSGGYDGTSDSNVRAALRRVSNYCESLPPNSEAAIDCWDAFNYFANEAVSAEQQCDLEPASEGMKGHGCTNFLQWESFVRQVEASGGVKQMVKTILAVKNAEDNQFAMPTKSVAKKSSIVPVSDILGDTHTRTLCEKLFDMKDQNNDGRINVEEFRSLMKLLGDEVHGETISVMFDSLGIRGSLDFDDFLTILEAEAIRSHSQTAGMLRSAQKHGHSGDRPKWLDNI